MEKNLPRIERGITKIIVPHGKDEVAFAWPSQGPDDYQTIGKRFLARNLKVPTGDYTASLAHAVYCNPETENEPEFKKIRNMGKRWLWVFNKDVWTSKGVYVVPDVNAIGTSQTLNQDELEKMLNGGKELSWGGIRFSKDGRVRFAPKGSYKLGKHTPESLAKDGFVIASYGLEGAEKLGEVSSKFRYDPNTYGGHNNIQKELYSEQRVSALSGNYGDRLSVIGDLFNDYWGGLAFGVQEIKQK